MATTIDVHAHWIPEALRGVLRTRDAAPRCTADGDRVMVDCGGGLVYPLLPGLDDVAPHLARMDRQGVAHTLLSVPPPGVAGLPAAEAAAVARACNDELAALPAQTGGRLGGLALLPVGDPAATADELVRAAGLGLTGAQLPSNAEGRALDGEEYWPLLGAAAQLGLPLVIHPVLPRDRIAVADYGLLSTLGFVYDTSVCAARLVLSGVYERHPDLKLVLPHAGATLPGLLGRFDYELHLMGASGALSTPASEQLSLLYLDSICESAPALRLALDTYGVDRVLYGSDEPFWSGARSRATLDALNLDSASRAAIDHGNAARLFTPQP